MWAQGPFRPAWPSWAIDGCHNSTELTSDPGESFSPRQGKLSWDFLLGKRVMATAHRLSSGLTRASERIRDQTTMPKPATCIHAWSSPDRGMKEQKIGLAGRAEPVNQPGRHRHSPQPFPCLPQTHSQASILSITKGRLSMAKDWAEESNVLTKVQAGLDDVK